jgi:ABC-2 type transport system permease protein
VARERSASELSPLTVLTVLLRADATVQTRSYQSLLLTLLLPIVLLVSMSFTAKRTALLGGRTVVVALVLTLGLVSIGAVGYALSIATDRDRGVLQRLRVTPAPTWTIMGSRWIVQMASAVVMSIVVFITAGVVDNLTFSFSQYVLTLVAAVLGSAIFLSIGQAIAGLITSAATLNATGRLIYIPLVGLSLFGHSTVLGTTFELVSRWSPGGCLESLLTATLGGADWSSETWGALAASLAYTVVFAAIGVRFFRWTGR